MKTLLLMAALLGSIPAMLATTSLSGKVTDSNGEPIIFGNVALYQKGILITGKSTDFDGNYNIDKLKAGYYDLQFSYVGFMSKTIKGVKIIDSKVNKFNEVLNIDEVQSCIVLCDFAYIPIPDYQADNLTSGANIPLSRDGYLGYMDRRYSRKRKKNKRVIPVEQMQELPTHNTKAIVADITSCTAADAGDRITVRGCRVDACSFYIDGERVCNEDHHPEHQELTKVPVKKSTINQYTPETISVICVPNPASSKTRICFPIEVQDVIVYSMEGKIQGKWNELNHAIFDIAVANWPSGTYHVIAMAKNQIYQSKLVVTR